MNSTNDVNYISTPLTSREADDLNVIELLFFSYRDFTADPDLILEKIGFGRAHHRVLYFINRKPGMTVAELLEVLRITKQSLSRVLKQLIDTGHVIQTTGVDDRRHRKIYPTKAGRELTLALALPQSRRIARALEESGTAERQIIERFLYNMVNPERRTQIDDFAATETACDVPDPKLDKVGA
ncbi:MarR family winged helix-turn-helix transcriptional regulator [Brucella gallinifaecis]|uniref:MarR family transcriptional regulator n=1 Tax=Brucella gallinifaecis TaxID=215590 RepID=A0A502BTS4_9HYPH|nr:MarR family transcriptional regulator [Brucella gallinifaecis]TPF76558.1 MarR family transcriptional regulator [Brucella gallinifaecis]